MDLVDHARRELELAGQFDDDPQRADAILRAVADFAAYGAQSYDERLSAIDHLITLLRWGTLSALTDDEQEWVDVSERFGGRPMWQSVRVPDAFSADAGKTYTVIGDGEPKRSAPTPSQAAPQSLWQTEARR